MNTHNIKIKEEHFNNVAAGTKTFEIRVNDRAYQKGDKVVMSRFYSDGQIWGQKIYADVGDVYPIESDVVVFSLLNVEVKE